MPEQRTGLITDALSLPVFLIKLTWEVVYANPAARKALDGRLGLLLQADKLATEEEGLKLNLQKLLDTMATEHRDDGAVGLRRSTGELGAVLHLTLVGRRGVSFSIAGFTETLAAKEGFLAVIHHAHVIGEEGSHLREVLGLSAVEAQIASLLCAGYSPREISVLRKATEQTVRWHIKNIHSKVGTRRQAELLALIQAARTPFSGETVQRITGRSCYDGPPCHPSARVDHGLPSNSNGVFRRVKPKS